jgi:hypothetical protein
LHPRRQRSPISSPQSILDQDFLGASTRVDPVDANPPSQAFKPA